ncbi:unnamed protein product [Oppiella nova]|uniref:Phospholipase A2-like central domain-containing protein n=1 Tax=Oppiella nova TaxID=334625 RepID=A0A7R9LC18_9ACAR|nr:unnamed protein product [Oppiella nova]CAG2161460.1 unnamed protein product [Oppiella nova]
MAIMNGRMESSLCVVSVLSAIETKYYDLCLRQYYANGTHLIQLWLSNDELLDCEFTTDTKSVRQFLSEFKRSDVNAFNQNQTYFSANGTDLWPQWSYLTDYKQYHDRCHRLHKKLLKQMNFKSKSKSKNKKKSELQRWKRADLLVFPGTNWCGKGSNSKSFEDLGHHSFADRCCRDHDYCTYTIPPFSSKYHLFNYRFHYVSHCSCDESMFVPSNNPFPKNCRFRSCLKLANTGAANLVGKLFFNVVQTKCFLFRTEKVCSRRSWWGRCLSTKRKKKAFFRNGLKY